jgi:hypothetical protein
MTANGFQPGQSGVGADIGIVYCVQHDEFRRRFSELAPTIRYDDQGACTDLSIYASKGASAKLREIRFEGVTLEELLAEEGIEFASDATRRHGRAERVSAVRPPATRELWRSAYPSLRREGQRGRGREAAGACRSCRCLPSRG